MTRVLYHTKSLLGQKFTELRDLMMGIEPLHDIMDLKDQIVVRHDVPLSLRTSGGGESFKINGTSPYTSSPYNQTSCDVTNTRRGTTRSLHSKAGLHLAPFGASFCFVGGETPSESTVTGPADLDKRVGVP